MMPQQNFQLGDHSQYDSPHTTAATELIDHLENFKRVVNLRLLAVAMITIVSIGWLAGTDFFGLSLLWINLYWILSAALAFKISLIGLPTRQGLRRTVRVALALSLGCYFAGQLVWGVQVLLDWRVVPGPSDLLFLFVPFPAIWAALTAIRSRVSPATGTKATCDAVSMLLAIVAIILAVLGSRTVGVDFIEAATLLLYPILYLSPVGAFLVTSFAVREEPRIGGNWLIMLGALILGSSFFIWTTSALIGEQSAGTLVDFFFGVGVILIGLGAATLDQVPASSEAKRRRLILLSELLPLVAIVAAVITTLLVDLAESLKFLIWVVIITLLLINGFPQIFLIRSYRQAQERLRTLAAELSNAEETERREIATYLHDKVGQAIAVMSLKFGKLRDTTEATDRNRLLDEVDSMLSDVADNVRSSTFDISPPILYQLGLVPALCSLADALYREFSVGIKVVDNGMRHPIPDSVVPLLYRFTRELLLNVVKHADARNATVTLGQDRANSYIHVRDDGSGFDAESVTIREMGGFGLLSILERARAIGGRFDIQSVVGEGTKASIFLPIEYGGSTLES